MQSHFYERCVLVCGAVCRCVGGCHRHTSRRRLACAEARSETKRQRAVATEAAVCCPRDVWWDNAYSIASSRHTLPRQVPRMDSASVYSVVLRWATHASSRLAPVLQLPQTPGSPDIALVYGGSRHHRRRYGNTAIAVVSSGASCCLSDVTTRL